MADNRVYEVMYIADPKTTDADIAELNSEIEKLITSEGGSIVTTEDMGRRPLAYRIKNFTEGYYYLFEIEGSGSEIAEMERRMRVNDKIFRYLTVRVDEERKTADKIVAKREARKEKLSNLVGGGDSQDETAGDAEATR
ncbi:MAG: 30S ribosomal protein S6 [Pyrinomonadaceae bacterium]|nr:30S ribosomal protein S6 [Pyrinomonadaceae bacterium]